MHNVDALLMLMHTFYRFVGEIRCGKIDQLWKRTLKGL